jgi:hypothetical protein
MNHSKITCAIGAAICGLALCVVTLGVSYNVLGPLVYWLAGPVRVPEWVMWRVFAPLLSVSALGLFWFTARLAWQLCIDRAALGKTHGEG